MLKKVPNLSSIVLRLISTLILLFITLTLYIWKKEDGLSIFIFIVSILVFFEFKNLLFSNLKISAQAKKLFLLAGSLILILSFVSKSKAFLFLPLMNENQFFSAIGVLFVFYILIALWIFRNQSNSLLLDFLLRSHFCIFYCTLPPLLAQKTLYGSKGIFWFFSFIFIIAFNDTFCFMIGKKFGKNKLFPHISPNKSIQGSLGGLSGALMSLSLIFLIFKQQVPSFLFMIFFAFILALSAQAGDYFESLIKRIAKVKDSSFLLPGHGGIADRMDGFYFGVPIMYGASLFFQ